MSKIHPLWIAFWIAAAIACVVTWIWGLSGGFGACVKGTTQDWLQKTAATVDGTIDTGIKTSIALVGAGTAILIGLKKEIEVKGAAKAALLLGVLLFGQSAIAGVLWKLELANGWLNECLNLMTEDVMKRLYAMSFDFFLVGIASALVMVCILAWPKTTEGVDS